MQLLCADFILVCNASFDIIQHGAIAFEESIIEVGLSHELKQKYPHAKIIETDPNSVILPGLINTHVHLEFSANATLLHYGDFMQWLHSVIKHRETLSELATTELIASKLKSMLKSGTTSLGAISSFGADLQACSQTPQRVVYFNEILGSSPSSVDVMYADFMNRFEISKEHASSKFFPSVSVHSPYSTHPILTQKALALANEEGCVVSTHFMENQAERVWLDEGQGEFHTFLSTFNPHVKPFYRALDYLKFFANTPTLFTHGVQANADELSLIAEQQASLTHCPVSNRLLGVGRLDLQACQKSHINLTLGTDGLSSNISLNLWDEMRSSLMMHYDKNLHDLAKMMLQCATFNAAKAFKLPCGSLEKGLWADMIVVSLPQACEKEDVALQLILHTHQTTMNFINGECYV